jgi:hypothetical protein
MNLECLNNEGIPKSEGKAVVISFSAFSFRPAISPPVLRLWDKSVSEAGKIDNGTTAH